MDRAVYAIFRDRQAARAAMDALISEGIPEELIDVQLHTGELDVEELPSAATASARFVKIGTPMVAIIGAIAGAITAGWVGALLGLLFGAVLGTVAAALSGSIDAKPAVIRLGNRLSGPFRGRLGKGEQAEQGRTLMLIELSDDRAGLDYEQFLQQHGAVRVGMT